MKNEELTDYSNEERKGILLFLRNVKSQRLAQLFFVEVVKTFLWNLKEIYAMLSFLLKEKLRKLRHMSALGKTMNYVFSTMFYYIL